MIIQKILQNCDLPPLESELLLSYVLKKPREYLFAHPEKKLTAFQVKKFKSLAVCRAQGEPIAYLTGKKEFYGLEFTLNRNVFIPRPETELLVELALENIENGQYTASSNTNIIDVGTGSGNIIISIVKNIPDKKRKYINFYATDISRKALVTARKNAQKHKVDKYIKFVKSNLLKFAYRKKFTGKLIIIANLPYVSESLYQKNKNNLKYEPKKALVSQKRGLEHYSRLLKQIKQILTRSNKLQATCYGEISPEQKNFFLKIIQEQLPRAKINFFKDLQSRSRAAKISLS